MEETKKQSRQMKYISNKYTTDEDFKAKLKQQVNENYKKRYNSDDPVLREATRKKKAEANKEAYAKLKQRNAEYKFKMEELEKLKREYNIL
jgi:hypothetical protein